VNHRPADDLGALVVAAGIIAVSVLAVWALSLAGIHLCTYQSHLWGWC
jgi:hypothetical protein